MRIHVLNVSAWLMLGFVLAGCSGKPSGTSGPSPTPLAPSKNQHSQLVTGRSHTLTDIHAAGIQVPPGAVFSLSIGKHQLTITAADWDTIDATSTIDKLVSVMFSPDFNVTDPTTRNRFQYLADRISMDYGGQNFESLSIVPGVSTGQFVDIAALFNPANQLGQLSGLRVDVIAKPSLQTIASQDFYATPHSAITIGARTIYFARLTFTGFSGLAPANNDVRNYTINFRYAHFVECPDRVCPTT